MTSCIVNVQKRKRSIGVVNSEKASWGKWVEGGLCGWVGENSG